MPVITLTTDFGTEDSYVGVMKGVILSIAPSADIIDITHNIKPQNIKQAAFVFNSAYRYFPDGAIHVVVIDPGVGSGRRPIILEAVGHLFVGPDNGVFTKVIETVDEYSAFEISNPEKMLTPVSATFHGRDVFAPAAAHLAKGSATDSFGPKITNLVTLDLPKVIEHAGRLVKGEIITIDRFGNAITNISVADVATEKVATIEHKAGAAEDILPSYSAAFDDKSLNAIIGSWETVELFVQNGSAAQNFGLAIGDTVEVSFI